MTTELETMLRKIYRPVKKSQGNISNQAKAKAALIIQKIMDESDNNNMSNKDQSLMRRDIIKSGFQRKRSMSKIPYSKHSVSKASNFQKVRRGSCHDLGSFKDHPHFDHLKDHEHVDNDIESQYIKKDKAIDMLKNKVH